MDSFMTSSQPTLTTHARQSMKKTHPYWSSTPYLDRCSPINHWNEMTPIPPLKLTGEGKLYKRNNFLVWDIQNHYIHILLTIEKETAWVRYIRESTSWKKINAENMESLISKLNHATCITTPYMYSPNQLRNLLKRGKKWGPQQLH